MSAARSPSERDPRARRRVGRAAAGGGLREADYRGERFADHPRDVTNDPDLLNLTRPDVVARGPRALPRGRRRHRDDQHVHRDVDRPGRLRARGAGLRHERRGRAASRARPRGPDRFVAGSVGPLNVTLSLSPRVDEPGYRTHTLRRDREAYAEQMRGARRRRRRPAADRDGLRHAQRKAAIVAARETRAASCRSGSASRSSISRAHALRSDDRGVLDLDRARRPLVVGINCSLGAERDAPVRRRAGARSRPASSPATRTPGCPNAFGGYDETPDVTASLLARVRARRPAQHRRRLLRHDARAHRARSRRRSRGLAPRACPRRRRARAAAGSRRSRSGPRPASCMIGERTNVTGSARFRRLVKDGDFGGAVDGRARAGARRREPPRREHGRGHARRRRRDAHLPERDRHRARGRAPADHGRQLEVDRDRGRAASALQGKGVVNSITSRKARRRSSAGARVRDYGAGVVVMAFDEKGQATTVERKVDDLRARLRPARRRGRLPARGHHLRPERPRRRHRHRGARRLRARRSSRRCR